MRISYVTGSMVGRIGEEEVRVSKFVVGPRKDFVI